MDLTHTFTVPTPVPETWEHFQDIATVAQCFPGATVTEAEGDSFSGTVKVKLGPIALVYSGSGTFVEKDEAAHSFVVDAKGKDKRGNGTAGAKVTLSMADAASGGTEVTVLTDLAITGKPAQFGRGVMQDVSDKLLGQFVSCLEQRLAAPEPEAVADSAPAEPEGEPSAAAGGSPVVEAADQLVAEPTSAPAVEDSRPEPAAAATAQPAPPRVVPDPAPASDDALDLGATVLPVLLKGYWKQGVAGLVGLVLAVLAVRRLRK